MRWVIKHRSVGDKEARPVIVPYTDGLYAYLADSDNVTDYLDAALELGDVDVTSLAVKNILMTKRILKEKKS
jgi:glucosamine 6-phosphate synthetase-like amidotransferase/phosphosugar isomerase protein